MEQARYWMWAKRKHSNFISGGAANSHDVHLQLPSVHVDDDSSWEEQAFAEDAAGPLGGCIWPPRSYSCSFCRREFRSAQALGGHMNVHRRDRARLKQSPSSHDQTVENSHHHHDSNDQSHRDDSVQINPFSSSSLQANRFHQYPSHHHQVCALVYNPNNPTSSDDPSSPASASRVSAQLPAGTEKITLSTLPCSRSSPSPSTTRSILTPNRYYTNNNSASRNYTELAAEKISRVVESSGSCRANPGNDLSVSLSLVVRCGARSSVSADEDEEDEEAILSCKRRRITEEEKPSKEPSKDSLPFFLKSEGFEVLSRRPPTTGSIEELDLELRLGDRPPKWYGLDISEKTQREY